MSSTTTNLGLVKMASGETIGQWSDANNGSGQNLDKIDTAIGTLNSQINTAVKQKDYYDITTEADLKTALADMISKTPSNASTYFILRTLSASSALLGIAKGVYACISCRTSSSEYGTILIFSYANNEIYKFRYNAGVSNESYICKYEGTQTARW